MTLNYSRILTIEISDNDLNEIKSEPNLAISKETTYLSISGPALQDVFSNQINTISQSNALAALNFIDDTTSPSLQNFTVDMNEGQLILTFDEVVLLKSFIFNEFQLQSEEDVSSAETFNLTGGIVSGDYLSEVVVNITSSDLTSLQLRSGLATRQNNTYLSFGIFSCQGC